MAIIELLLVNSKQTSGLSYLCW